MEMPGVEAVIRLDRDEAMILSDLLSRWEERDGVSQPEHICEWVALWNLLCLLESALGDVQLNPEYDGLVADARSRLKGADDANGQP